MKKLMTYGLIILSLVTVLLSGCAEQELSQEEVEQLVSDVLQVNAKVETCKFDLHTITTIEQFGGTMPNTSTMEGTGSGAIDSANRKMQMLLNMDINIPNKETKSMSLESYIVGGWMYITMNLPDEGETQAKMQIPDEIWDQQSQIDQQIRFLETADNVTYIGTENIDGSTCYVVEIEPSLEVLGEFLSKIEMPEIDGVDPLDINFADLVKEMSFKQWIDKDSHLIIKTESRMNMEIRPEDVGADEVEFERITMQQTSDMEFYDYNTAVSIEAPTDVSQE
jgi:outer membrane murein-binding lipoprotein Lpp